MEVDKHEILITAAPTDSCWDTQYPAAAELDAPSIKVEAFSDGKRVYSIGQQSGRVEFISDWEKYFLRVNWSNTARSCRGHQMRLK